MNQFYSLIVTTVQTEEFKKREKFMRLHATGVDDIPDARTLKDKEGNIIFLDIEMYVSKNPVNGKIILAKEHLVSSQKGQEDYKKLHFPGRNDGIFRPNKMSFSKTENTHSFVNPEYVGGGDETTDLLVSEFHKGNIISLKIFGEE